MGRSKRFDDIEHDERHAYRSCKRKRKMKSSEANKLAPKYNQRKYQCPICGHWHLTKLK